MPGDFQRAIGRNRRGGGGFQPPAGNILANWRGTGGATGAPGTEPTGYDFASVAPAGCTFERVAITPYRGGFIHLVRLSGTPASAVSFAWSSMPAYAIGQPYDGQSWRAEVSVRLAAGSMTGFDTFILRQRQVVGIGLSGITPTGTWQRVGHSQVMPAGSIDLRHQFRSAVVNPGFPVDLTLEFFAPTLSPG